MTPGERRPREGRCERCDRPLTDLVWTTWTPISVCGPELQPVTDWREETPTDDTRCWGEPLCSGVEIDWKARALAAEARLSVPATSAALNAFRAKRDATHVCEHGSLARKCGDCDSVENGLEAEAWQARALALEAACIVVCTDGERQCLLCGEWADPPKPIAHDEDCPMVASSAPPPA